MIPVVFSSKEPGFRMPYHQLLGDSVESVNALCDSQFREVCFSHGLYMYVIVCTWSQNWKLVERVISITQSVSSQRRLDPCSAHHVPAGSLLCISCLTAAQF